jgi:hypothetical protein
MVMNYVYIVFEEKYGNFDVPYNEIYQVCYTETDANSLSETLNSKRVMRYGEYQNKYFVKKYKVK